MHARVCISRGAIGEHGMALWPLLLLVAPAAGSFLVPSCRSCGGQARSVLRVQSARMAAGGPADATTGGS